MDFSTVTDGAGRLELEYPEGWVTSEYSEEQEAEVTLFGLQDRFKIAKEKLLTLHEEKQRQLEYEYEREVETLEHNITMPFTLAVWEHGIEKIRKRAIPAYVFERFLDLPKEIQLTIWDMAILPTKPKTHILMSMMDENYGLGDGDGTFYPNCSTSVFIPPESVNISTDGNAHRHGPCQWYCSQGPFALSEVCRDSFITYIRVHARLPHKNAKGGGHVSRQDINTMDNQFYLGNQHWTTFKILIDLVIKHNTTRAFSNEIARDIAGLQTIRHLIVDLNIFGGVPLYVWTHFTKLETLAISFYTFDTIGDDDSQFLHFPSGEDEDEFDLKFIKPRRRSKFVRRAKEIFRLASRSLALAAKEAPKWKKPKLEVVFRHNEMTDFIEDSESENEEEYCENGDEEGNETDDQEDWDAAVTSDIGTPSANEYLDAIESLKEHRDWRYLQQIPSRMTHPPVPQEQIKRWKQRFHPSRRIKSDDETEETNEGKVRYYADSEGGTDDERPFEKAAEPEEQIPDDTQLSDEARSADEAQLLDGNMDD